MAAFICNSCMNGHHEVPGNGTCECVCHNNPTCEVCGEICLTGHWAHESCINDLDDQEHERMMEALNG